MAISFAALIGKAGAHGQSRSRDGRRRRSTGSATGPARGLAYELDRPSRGAANCCSTRRCALGELYMDGRLDRDQGHRSTSSSNSGARNLVGAEGRCPGSRRSTRPASHSAAVHQRNDRRRAKKQHRPSLRPRRAPLPALPRPGPAVFLRLFRAPRPVARRRADGEEAPYRRQAAVDRGRIPCSISAAASAAWRSIWRESRARRSTGVTLSQEQFARRDGAGQASGLADRVDFRLQDYRDVGETFDRIVSVGMFEHVGVAQLRRIFPDRCDACSRTTA